MRRAEDLVEHAGKAEKQRYLPRARKALQGSRQSAIELKCLECCAFSMSEAQSCHITRCALWEFGPAGKKARRLA